MAEKHSFILEVKNLSLELADSNHPKLLLENISFAVEKSSRLAVIGESGSGKTMLAYALLNLLPPGIKQSGGEIILDGQILSSLQHKPDNSHLGYKITMIFQDAAGALNPVFTVGEQMREVIRTHQKISKKVSESYCIHLLNEVGLAPEMQYYYPHQLSGGMAQRVMIAMALSCKPEILIADEPTTALDVTTQSVILNLILRLQKVYQYALLFISHDMFLVSHLTNKTIVLREGQVVESGDPAYLLQHSSLEYTRSLCTPLIAQRTI